MATQRYQIENHAKLNCFSRFLYGVCSTLIEKVYDAVTPFMSKGRKRRYDRIMMNITEDDELRKMTHRDVVVSSRAIRLFIGAIDAVIAMATAGLIVVGVVQYFRYLM